MVVASLRKVADADRMGALAKHVAKIVRRRHPAHATPEDVNSVFAEMGRIAVERGSAAKDVVLSGDPGKAAQFDHDDDAMDDLHRRRLGVLMDPEWKYDVAAAVDVTLLGRYYERFANHAVEIGRRVGEAIKRLSVVMCERGRAAHVFGWLCGVQFVEFAVQDRDGVVTVAQRGFQFGDLDFFGGQPGP